MADPAANPISVSAIVPARNEEAVIAACVASLVGQPEIGEVLVIDDQSSDHTRAIVRNLTARFPKLKLLEAGELPSGWVGKNHAVWLGAAAATGEWLLFTDADAVHQHDSAARALAMAEENCAELLSFSPEQVMETWYERSLIPYVYCRLGSRFSFAEVNDPNHDLAAANGQFLLVRRAAYQAVGGHSSVAGEVLEDVGLARRLKRGGHRIWFASGRGVVRVRMYRSFRAIWEGWRKNLYPLLGGGQALAREMGRAILPVIATLLAAALLWGSVGSLAGALVVVAAGFLTLSSAYASELRHNQFPARLAGYGIPGRMLFAAVLWASYRSHRKGKLEWKGREYPVGTPGASNR